MGFWEGRTGREETERLRMRRPLVLVREGSKKGGSGCSSSGVVSTIVMGFCGSWNMVDVLEFLVLRNSRVGAGTAVIVGRFTFLEALLRDLELWDLPN